MLREHIPSAANGESVSITGKVNGTRHDQEFMPVDALIVCEDRMRQRQMHEMRTILVPPHTGYIENATSVRLWGK
jgi:hypothetical protein